MSSPRAFRLGLVINPFAGVGGPSGNKGSDDVKIQAAAKEGVLPLTARQRARTFVEQVAQLGDGADVVLVTVAGDMGGGSLVDCGMAIEYVDFRPPANSTAEDTQHAVMAIQSRAVDLLVFVGGDGTARDVCQVVNPEQVVLGIPAGVKMHSGVFAINPQAAAKIVADLISGQLVRAVKQEVRDIDEQAFRQGRVNSRYFGEMLTPEEAHFIQSVKQGGFEVEDLVLLDIAEDLKKRLSNYDLIILGPGSTTFNIALNWGLQTTLLGVDLIRDGRVIAADVDAKTLAAQLSVKELKVALVITVIGGQGHIIGRGNQQLRSDLLRRIGREHLYIVATKTKLKSLAGRPLVMDSGDYQMDQQWRGYVPVLTGYDDLVLYPLGIYTHAD